MAIDLKQFEREFIIGTVEPNPEYTEVLRKRKELANEINRAEKVIKAMDKKLAELTEKTIKESDQ